MGLYAYAGCTVFLFVEINKFMRLSLQSPLFAECIVNNSEIDHVENKLSNHLC